MTAKLILVMTLLMLAVCAWAQEAAQEMDPAMKAYMEAATPGEPHKMLQNLVGTWEATVKSFMNPAEPSETKGTSTFVSVMDGRYVQETAEGNFMGTPFHGMGTYGYDNVLKKYVSAWIDTMGTGVMTSTGTSPDGGKTINWTGTSSDAMTGKEQTYTSIMHMINNDQYHFEMHGPGPDGKPMKMMEILYNRKK